MPKTLEVFNIWYFMYIIIGALIVIGGYFLMRKRSKRAQKIFIFTLCAINLAVHFLKLLLPEYQVDYPSSWRKTTFESICDVSVLTFPFIFMTKNKTLKDYVVLLSMIGGAVAFFVPTGAWGYEPFRLATGRFYLSHLLLVCEGVYMIAFDIHRPAYERLWRAPIMLFLVLGLILVNEVIVRSIGLTEQTLGEMLTNLEQRNAIYLFGFPENIADKLTFVTALVPDFMKQGFDFYGNGVSCGYWPWLWMFCPIMVYGEIFIHLFGLIWEHKRIKEYFKKKKLKKDKADVAY